MAKYPFFHFFQRFTSFNTTKKLSPFLCKQTADATKDAPLQKSPNLKNDVIICETYPSSTFQLMLIECLRGFVSFGKPFLHRQVLQAERFYKWLINYNSLVLTFFSES